MAAGAAGSGVRGRAGTVAHKFGGEPAQGEGEDTQLHDQLSSTGAATKEGEVGGLHRRVRVRGDESAIGDRDLTILSIQISAHAAPHTLLDVGLELRLGEPGGSGRVNSIP